MNPITHRLPASLRYWLLLPLTLVGILSILATGGGGGSSSGGGGSVSAPTPVSIGIVAPVFGDLIDATRVLVSGIVDGPANTGVTVNGVVTRLFAGQFFATVPLVPGENTLTATATTLAGATASDSVVVTGSATELASVQVVADPESGIAPLTVQFTVMNNTGDPVQRFEVDFDGDGSVDVTTTDPNALVAVHTYPTPGVFQAKTTVTDGAGIVHTTTHVVVINDAAQMDQLFTELWDGMNRALINGDVAGAVGFLNQGAMRKYQPVFEVLLPHMPEIIASYSPLQRVSISADIGEYAIVRRINGQQQLYLIYFLKDADGVWRLDEM